MAELAVSLCVRSSRLRRLRLSGSGVLWAAAESFFSASTFRSKSSLLNWKRSQAFVSKNMAYTSSCPPRLRFFSPFLLLSQYIILPSSPQRGTASLKPLQVRLVRLPEPSSLMRTTSRLVHPPPSPDWARIYLLSGDQA